MQYDKVIYKNKNSLYALKSFYFPCVVKNKNQSATIYVKEKRERRENMHM